tara:strand:- start:3080 stop:3646 length:567 start_codon:yes stop_codon:yes gene_type:complete
MVNDFLTIQRDDSRMRFAFFTSWILLLAAFAAAAAETIARTLPGGSGWVLSSAELWRALWPGAFLLSEVQIVAIAPWLWDPVISSVLTLPAWLLLGLPGVALAWACRPGRDLSPEAEEELHEHEVSLFFYDDLAREARQWARDSGEDTDIDDRLPTHDLIDLIDGRDYDEDDDLANHPVPEFVRPSKH